MISLINYICCMSFFFLVYLLFIAILIRRDIEERCFYTDLNPPWNIKLYCVLAHKVLRLAGPAGFFPVGSFVLIYLISWKSNITTKSLCSDLVDLMVSCTILWIQLLHKVESGQPIAELLQWIDGGIIQPLWMVVNWPAGGQKTSWGG